MASNTNIGNFAGSDSSFAQSVIDSTSTRPQAERGISALADTLETPESLAARFQNPPSSSSPLAQTSSVSSTQPDASTLGKQAFGSSTANTSSIGNTSSGSSTGLPSLSTGSNHLTEPTKAGDGLQTPDGVSKSKDPVENLLTAIAGVAITAPIAAIEALTGHASNAAQQVKAKADEAGVTKAVVDAQNVVVSAAGQAQPYVQPIVQPIVQTTGQALNTVAAKTQEQLNAARGPNAPSLQDYAASAQQSASNLANKLNSGDKPVTQQASDLASHAASSVSQTAQSIYATAANTVSNATNASSQALNNLGQKVGVVKAQAQEAAVDAKDSAVSAKNSAVDSTQTTGATSSGPAFGGSSDASFRSAAQDNLAGAGIGGSTAGLNSGTSFENTRSSAGDAISGGPYAGSAHATADATPLQPGSAEYGAGQTGTSTSSGVQL